MRPKFTDKLSAKDRIKYLIALILWLILVVFFSRVQAQDNISVGLYQDARLLFIGDDKGNDALTLDAKIDISLQGYQFNLYYFEMRVQGEYAKLSGGDYTSLLVNPNWVFNQQFQNIEISGGGLIGLIWRWNQSYITYGLSADISYILTPRLKLSALGQLISRGDLYEKWNDSGLKPNFYIGLKYNLKQ